MMTSAPTAGFWDRIAERYAKQPVADEAAYRNKLRITQEYLRPDMEVLEIGCGTGSTALVHAPFVTHIHAIDISSRMIEIARRKADAGGVTNVTFQRAAVAEFDAPDASYDAVLALSILHLVDDRDAAMAKIHRMLKPGGIFVSSTPCIADAMKWFKFIAPIGRVVGLLPLVRVFGAAEFARSFPACGFTIDRRWQPGKGKAVFIVAKKPG